MTEHASATAELARDLVRIDSRSFVSNCRVAERIEAELPDFEIEHLDYRDNNGVEKRALVAHRGPKGGLALSGHMDTVPDTGWRSDPWAGRIEGARLQGLGSTDMKGPVAAAIVAARALPREVPITLLLTTDEEVTKAGAREIARRSALAREAAPLGIVVVEPTRMTPMRGHRVHIVFTAVATGIQAHSSTGRGRNANWDLLPFLVEMRALHERLREDAALQDPAYDPPFSDFNLVLDNHGSAVNVTVPKATATIKFRHSAKIDPQPVADIVRAAARRAGLDLSEVREGSPPELPETHPLVRLCSEVAGLPSRVAAFGTDASELQALAPCVIMGPGDIAVAHAPEESVSLSDLAAAVPVFMSLAQKLAETGRAGWR
ncbi:MAG TPA: M20/M25/M40 family metallo-hydrolase [Xanthobacteraceae bacterium]|jgi:acetylornithine deacetylase/succinyl-diaminopimelate desuccinylase-like protein